MKPVTTITLRLVVSLMLVLPNSGASATPNSEGESTARREINSWVPATTAAVDVVFAIDNTGSMGGVIDQVEADAQYILDRIRVSAPDSYFGAIKFRDHGDTFVTEIATNLTSDLEAVKAAISAMTAGGGGDTPEAYIETVFQGINEIVWRTDSIKLIVVMGDAPPHDPVYGTGSSPNGWYWADAVSLASNAGVKVSMVAVGYGVGDSIVQASYEYMATATGGLYREAPDSSTLADDLIALIEELSGNTPLVINTYPVNDASAVPTDAVITATFNIPVDSATLNSYTMLVSSAGMLNRLGEITYDADTRTVSFQTNSFTPLYPGTQYTVTLTSGILGATSPQKSLPLTTWTFTTYGTSRERLITALDRLRAETEATVDYNAQQAANILGTAKSRTSVSLVKLAAEWAVDLLSGSVTPPAGLPANVVKGLGALDDISKLKYALDANHWISDKIDAAPEDEAGAQSYFYNSLQSDVTLQDERSDGSVVWTGTGYMSLKADLLREYDETVAALAALPDPLPEVQAETVIALVEEQTAKVRAARSSEVNIGVCDEEVGLVCELMQIGTVFTQKKMFDDVLAHWETVDTFNTTITWTKVGVGSVKLVSAICIGFTIGSCAVPAGLVFAKSELVVWTANLVDTGETIYELATLPSEQVLIQAITANSAALQENIQLRIMYLGTTARVLGLLETFNVVTSAPEQGAALTSPADDVQLLDYQIGDVTLTANQSIGVGLGTFEVLNSGASTKTIMGVVMVVANSYGTGADVVTIGATDQFVIAPGASTTLPFSLDVPVARAVSPEGYEAQLFIQIEDAISGRIDQIGPYLTFFYAGTTEENNAFQTQVPVQLLSGDLTNGQVAEQLYTTVTSAPHRIRFTLAQELDTNLDLHVYDSLGQHTGLNYSTGIAEITSGATYSGRDVQRETIEVDSTSGPFRVQVVALDAAGTAYFEVTTYEQAPIAIYLPLVYMNNGVSAGFDSQFNGSATGWEVHSGAWAVDSAFYSTPGVANFWSSASYVSTFTDFDYQAQLWRYGCNTCSNHLAIRGTPYPLGTNHNWYSYYIFQYTRDGYYSIWKRIDGGTSVALQNWTFTSAINTYDAWNTLRVIASSGSFYFYINDILVWIGTDTSLIAGRAGVGMYQSVDSTGNYFYVNWATLSPLSASASEILDKYGQVSAEQQALNATSSEQTDGGIERRDNSPP